ncbi:MAG: ABC transporter ATP-binding protein [Acidobacteriota bacterium]
MKRSLFRRLGRLGDGRWAQKGRSGRFVLEADHLVVRYSGASRPAIDEVTFAVEPGECVVLTGDNGSGKSTLLKTAAGLLEPQGGAIRVFGSAAGRHPARVSYLPQRSELAWRFPIDVHELVLTGRFVHLGWVRRPGREDHRLVEQALDRLGIRTLARLQIGELSGGQQQRVLLARTLVHDADLILLDEPLNGVDAETVEVIRDVLDGMVREGRSLLVASHDHDRLRPRSDRMIRLRSGRLVEDIQRGTVPGRGVASLAGRTRAREFVA